MKGYSTLQEHFLWGQGGSHSSDGDIISVFYVLPTGLARSQMNIDGKNKIGRKNFLHLFLVSSYLSDWCVLFKSSPLNRSKRVLQLVTSQKAFKQNDNLNLFYIC